MIQVETKLKIADNSGAVLIKCIKILGGSNRKKAFIGNSLITSVRKIRKLSISNKTQKSKQKILKGQISEALIIRTHNKIHRKNGMKIQFDNNAAILLKANKTLKATRIFGPVTYELRKQNFMQVLSLASTVI